MTKITLYFIFLLLSYPLVSQPDLLYDERNNKSYRTVSINNTKWMIEDLDFYTSLSRTPNDSLRKAHDLDGYTGRYYHFEEIESVCPEGWEIPLYSDWIEYFEFINSQLSEPLELEIVTVDNPDEDFHRYISGYEKKIDLFEEGNPLALYPIGRYQGENLSTNPENPFADYWTIDPQSEVKGKTHIHLWNEFTPIHSHEHHMDPNEEDKLRRFMVRCVQRD